MKFLISLSVVVALLLWYAIQGREWLKSKPWAARFFTLIEPVEILLFKKSETILFARLKIFSGLVLTLLTQIGSIDLTPLMPLVPDAYEPLVRGVFNLLPLTITLLGWIDESLRNRTSRPIEVVAVPSASMPPEVEVAIAQLDEAKAQAVATIQKVT